MNSDIINIDSVLLLLDRAESSWQAICAGRKLFLYLEELVVGPSVCTLTNGKELRKRTTT